MSRPVCFMRDFKRRQFERPGEQLTRVLLRAVYVFCILFTLAHFGRYLLNG